MNQEAPGAPVFAFADTLLRSAVQILSAQGPESGFIQAFDGDPDNDNGELEIHQDTLATNAARNLMRQRKNSGFKGICGFSCLELSEMRLYVEAFDTRRDISISLAASVRKTIFGRYRPANERAEILGEPTL